MTIIKVELDGSKLNTCERRQKASDVAQEMEIIINSEVFKDKFYQELMNRNYHVGETSKWKDTHPTEIIAHFYSGWERLRPMDDYIFQIDIDDYWTFKRVIGYTKSNISTVFVNTKYFDKRSLMLCGSNICHERGHNIGFTHDFRNTKRRKDSVCYILNDVYEFTHNKLFRDY